MNRWLPRDLTTAPLRKIDEGIAAIERRAMSDRSVADTQRLADLSEARRRITVGGRRGCG